MPLTCLAIIDDRYMKRRPNAAAIGKSLTVSETEVLRLIAQGETNKSIAYIRRISIKTVEKHRTMLMRKLDLHCVAHLTQYALHKGLIENRFNL